MTSAGKPVADDAAVWAVRTGEGPLNDEQQAELELWLASDERRAGALLRAQATLAYLDRGRALAEQGDIAEAEPEVVADGYVPAVGRRRFLIGGTLGGLVTAGSGGILLLQPRGKRFESALGEVRRVPLDDGSMLSLNTSSRVEVALTPERRAVALEDGEAWFQVAHDRRRPFVVAAGDVRVRAVGTAFAVRRHKDGADVLVTEGVVEAWIVGRDRTRLRIAAGERAFVATPAASAEPLAPEVVAAPDAVDRALAWRSGELVLNGESLSYAVAEINRYNRRRLVVVDPALGGEPLVGYFHTTQPEAFGRVAAGLIGARVEERGDEIRIVR